ncbi:MAG TPA: biotin carboxylase N-terminal domain-containing protein [Candidatus Binataceae bacterium]|nr:biotin carboxylase N-terminal domain-containing protein [Candidatus Binataceae bacterium]
MKGTAISKLLVANRGEIALRIIRSARLLGIATVAVYSEADAGAAHVAAADEARLIGPPEASASYLNIAAIIEAASTTGADAIHPGYGFLSERPEFARAVGEAGMLFVGPPAEVMAALGDKVAARRLAAEAGVPVVPGLDTIDDRAAAEFAARVGFPLMVKAAAGGGGRGMRMVETQAGLTEALAAASREAKAAFGDGRVFLEKYLARPRHVEVQVLADNHGGVVALGERDCSIQRRHQKIIEESPAPRLDDALRARMFEAALRVARVAGYRNAGTMEFLVDGSEFYFLEANTRLQVEHPVTEMRFGCDLVAEQLRVAMGGRVSEPAAPRGAAIECRIYAEDAEHSFRPATGEVLYLNLPGGPGVRVDTHLAAGLSVTAFYDGMLGKLICWGADREQARGRMAAALGEFSLLGITNTAAFLRDVVASAAFRDARLSTRFVEEFFPRWSPSADAQEGLLVAAAMAAAGALGAPRSAASGRSAVPGAAPDGAHPGHGGRTPWTELAGFEPWRRGGR